MHSPKFEHEADPEALAAAVERYEVRHPVLDDPELVTWCAYTARAWPTLVVIDPEGYIVAQMAGEGHGSAIAALVAELVAEHAAKGTLHRGAGPYVPPAPASGTLRFPAKALALPNGNLLVADAGHHSLAELAPDGETLVRRIGSGERGLVDGGPGEARFSEPNGLCLVPDDLTASLGYDVVVADTVNHALRGVRLSDGAVIDRRGHRPAVHGGRPGERAASGQTAGPAMPFDTSEDYPARIVKLSSPWDVEWSPELGAFVVAMAGNHTLWAFDPSPATRTERPPPRGDDERGPGGRAGHRGLVRAAVRARARRRRVASWLADARDVGAAPGRSRPATTAWPIRTAVGQGLFDFGHRDGAADQALLQHPLGVATLPDGSVVVADTYNGAVRRYDPATGRGDHPGQGPGGAVGRARRGRGRRRAPARRRVGGPPAHADARSRRASRARCSTAARTGWPGPRPTSAPDRSAWTCRSRPRPGRSSTTGGARRRRSR